MDRVCLICTDPIPSAEYCLSCSTPGCTFALCVSCASATEDHSRCGCGRSFAYIRFSKSRQLIPFGLENWLVQNYVTQTGENPLNARRIVWGFSEFYSLKRQEEDTTERFIPSPPIDRLWAMFQGDAKYYEWASSQRSDNRSLFLRRIPQTDLVTDPRYIITCALMDQPVDPVAWPNRPWASLRIFVRDPVGKTITLDVELGWSVSVLKSLIYKKIGVHPFQQRIIYAGRSLANDRSLGDYNIQKESTIHMVSVLRGD